jgi:hypothetical protein
MLMQVPAEIRRREVYGEVVNIQCSLIPNSEQISSVPQFWLASLDQRVCGEVRFCEIAGQLLTGLDT